MSAHLKKKHPIATTVLSAVEGPTGELRPLGDEDLQPIATELNAAIVSGDGIDATVELVMLAAFFTKKGEKETSDALLEIANEAIIAHDLGGVWGDIQERTSQRQKKHLKAFADLVGQNLETTAPKYGAKPQGGAVSLRSLQPPRRRIG